VFSFIDFGVILMSKNVQTCSILRFDSVHVSGKEWVPIS